MVMNTKNDIFNEKLESWLAAKDDRKKRGEITEAICLVTGMHRKSVSRKFRSLIKTKKTGVRNQPRHGRPIYTKGTLAALKYVFGASGEVCGELLHPVIKEYVAIFKKDNLWIFDGEATEQLLKMSKSTVRRKVRLWKIGHAHRGLSSTHPSPLKKIIPIFKGPWENLCPGNGQIDTVAHCGDSLQGEFVYTLNYTDYATYWVELQAQWGKGQKETKDGLSQIGRKLPFIIIMIHPDTGSEFINYVVKDYCTRRGIKMTRSEPRKSNDNMAVEERNGHLVRQALGYERLDKKELLPLINQFLHLFCLHRNHFVASRRTISKQRIGAKYVRTLEPIAKTPYQRVMNSSHVPPKSKAQLKAQHSSLNPLLLKQQYEKVQQQIFELQYAK